MIDETKDKEQKDVSLSDQSRREFVGLSLAAGLLAATRSASGKELEAAL